MTPVFNKKKQVKYGFQKAWPLQLQNAFPTVQLNMNIEKKSNRIDDSSNQ